MSTSEPRRRAVGPAGLVQIELHPLALTQHAEDRAVKSVVGQIDLIEVGLVDQHAVAGARVETLDDSLHGSRAYRTQIRADYLREVPSIAVTLDSIDAASLRRVVATFGEALTDHREVINNLNVYPVPDGDTGTNMSLTLRSVVEELDGSGDDMAAVCAGIAHGSLMGARGNSGVILSQILRGFSGVVADHAAIDGPLFAAALTAAAKGAYSAVGNPVEGTILTVVRESAKAATDAGTQGSGLCGVLEAARDEAAESLERTPTLLSVLADAGVVDAGGAGLLLLYDAALHVVDGRPLPEAALTAAPAPHHRSLGGSTRAEGGPSIADLRYEVMFLLDAPDAEIAGFKEAWAEVGGLDSRSRRRGNLQLPHPLRRHRCGHRVRHCDRAAPQHQGHRSARRTRRTRRTRLGRSRPRRRHSAARR